MDNLLNRVSKLEAELARLQSQLGVAPTPVPIPTPAPATMSTPIAVHALVRARKGLCARCGWYSHTVDRCYAKKHRSGHYLPPKVEEVKVETPVIEMVKTEVKKAEILKEESVVVKAKPVVAQREATVEETLTWYLAVSEAVSQLGKNGGQFIWEDVADFPVVAERIAISKGVNTDQMVRNAIGALREERVVKVAPQRRGRCAVYSLRRK